MSFFYCFDTDDGFHSGIQFVRNIMPLIPNANYPVSRRKLSLAKRLLDNIMS